LGGLAFIALLALALRSAFVRSASLAFGMLTAYVVANLFDDVLFTPRNGLMLAVAFALIAGGKNAKRSRDPGADGHRMPDETESAAPSGNGLARAAYASRDSQPRSPTFTTEA
jgi:hypothetical protein